MSDTDNPREPKEGLARWIGLAAVLLPILLLAAAVSWIRNDEPDRLPGDAEQSAEQEEGLAPDETGQFAVQQSTMGDFDSGRQVPSHSNQADFWYQARTGDDRFFTARNEAALAIVGRRDAPQLPEVKSVVQNRPAEKIDLNEMEPGLWIAVRTSEGNFAAYTIEAHAGISPGTLRLRYLLWESDGEEELAEQDVGYLEAFR